MQSRQPTTRCEKGLPYKVIPISPIQTPISLPRGLDGLPPLRKVNALKISTSDTDMGEISAIGTDLVGTSFQCHSHGTDFQ